MKQLEARGFRVRHARFPYSGELKPELGLSSCFAASLDNFLESPKLLDANSRQFGTNIKLGWI
jgi:hypothetical protein